LECWNIEKAVDRIEEGPKVEKPGTKKKAAEDV
jgi:hypothetical protein